MNRMKFLVFAVVLSALVLSCLARDYTVTREADFYKTLYNCIPGDTINVECDLRQGLVLDHGGDNYRLLTVRTRMGSSIGSMGAKEITISAPFVRLEGFKLQGQITVSAPSVTLQNLSSNFAYDVSDSRINVNNCTGTKATFNGHYISVSRSTFSDFTVQGSHSSMKDSAFRVFKHQGNDLILTGCNFTVFEVVGNTNVVTNCNSSMTDSYSSNVTGDYNKIDLVNFQDNLACTSVPVVRVNGSSNIVRRNTFIVNARSPCFYFKTKVIVEYDGEKNFYSENDCSCKTKTSTPMYFVYVNKDPKNDRVCATNSVNTGEISNVPIDRRC